MRTGVGVSQVILPFWSTAPPLFLVTDLNGVTWGLSFGSRSHPFYSMRYRRYLFSDRVYNRWSLCTVFQLLMHFLKVVLRVGLQVLSLTGEILLVCQRIQHKSRFLSAEKFANLWLRKPVRCLELFKLRLLFRGAPVYLRRDLWLSSLLSSLAAICLRRIDSSLSDILLNLLFFIFYGQGGTSAFVIIPCLRSMSLLYFETIFTFIWRIRILSFQEKFLCLFKIYQAKFILHIFNSFLFDDHCFLFLRWVSKKIFGLFTITFTAEKFTKLANAIIFGILTISRYLWILRIPQYLTDSLLRYLVLLNTFCVTIVVSRV